MNGHGGFGLGNTTAGQPGVLALQQGFEVTSETILVQFPGLETFQLVVQAPGQPREHEFD
jgi:hypothetical protein